MPGMVLGYGYIHNEDRDKTKGLFRCGVNPSPAGQFSALRTQKTHDPALRFQGGLPGAEGEF